MLVLHRARYVKIFHFHVCSVLSRSTGRSVSTKELKSRNKCWNYYKSTSLYFGFSFDGSDTSPGSTDDGLPLQTQVHLKPADLAYWLVNGQKRTPNPKLWTVLHSTHRSRYNRDNIMDQKVLKEQLNSLMHWLKILFELQNKNTCIISRQQAVHMLSLSFVFHTHYT